MKRSLLALGAAAALLVGPAVLAPTAAAAQTAQPVPAKSLLTPTDHILLMVDHQPQMAFAVQSTDIVNLRNNAALVTKSAKVFNVPTVLTSVAAESFSGPVWPEVVAAAPGVQVIDRTTMNAWEDKRITDAVNRSGKKKIVIAALWTEVCGIGPVLSALEQGYEVYFITDASGGISREAHEMAIERMVQAGATPITSIAYLLELQRDWARGGTYNAVTSIVKEDGGAYGLGVLYAKDMLGGGEGGKTK